MKHLQTILVFLFFSCFGFAQETTFKSYSYTAFFDLIEKEQDTLFELEDAVVRYNKETDSLFTGERDKVGSFITAIRKEPLIIDKEIKLKNVHFITEGDNRDLKLNGIIGNVLFKKKVNIHSMQSAEFYNCIFEERITNSVREDISKSFPFALERGKNNHFTFTNCVLKKSATVSYMLMDHDDVADMRIGFYDCEIYLNNEGLQPHQSYFMMLGRNLSQMILWNNTFHGEGTIHFRSIENIFQNIDKNRFNNAYVEIFVGGGTSFNRLTIEDNSFNKATFLEIDDMNREYIIPLEQFNGNLYSDNTYFRFHDVMFDKYPDTWDTNASNDSIILLFQQSIIQDQIIFDEEMSFKAQLHSFYKSRFNNRNANSIYVQTKNLETDRSKYLHKQTPSFKTFFTWKINQFLKVFSAYGTEPSRAIIFSMYVILFFAFIYLFFPNSWDSHGKNRIIDRYAFFMKYMRKKAGIHEVYLEDKKEELLTYEKFKDFVKSSEHEVPKIFTATALPFYKWAVSGTQLSSAFLKRIDIMKGTWSELPDKKRWWKGILLIGAFSIAILYDIFIKMLNALMLSINTFTTLGFGEIPIKGLPRYLAIIQGFIGWFMLTIFSVSLISQLLN